MVDPNSVANFERNDEELLEFAFFCVCVAGKNSQQQAEKLELFKNNTLQRSFLGFFNSLDLLIPIFGRGAIIDIIKQKLRYVKMGKYGQVAPAMWDLYILNKEIGLKNASLSRIEKIKYVGPKTARFFLINTRPNQPYAVLDTHILKFMRDCGIKTPKSTPSKNKYLTLEKEYRKIIMGMGVCPLPEQDLIIWKTYKYGKI